jgi:hypothetical protein
MSFTQAHVPLLMIESAESPHTRESCIAKAIKHLEESEHVIRSSPDLSTREMNIAGEWMKLAWLLTPCPTQRMIADADQRVQSKVTGALAQALADSLDN